LNLNRKTQRKELDGLYKNLDPKETGSITFHAYINDALGDSYDMDELEKSTADSSHDLHDVRVFYQTEKKKWYFITKGQDEMSREQFAAFIFSEDHQHIIDFENEMIFKLYDKNNDGFWSFDEYMQTVKRKLN
jgi:Ca2+-binding EF-hand superfamily protein